MALGSAVAVAARNIFRRGADNTVPNFLRVDEDQGFTPAPPPAPPPGTEPSVDEDEFKGFAAFADGILLLKQRFDTYMFDGTGGSGPSNATQTMRPFDPDYSLQPVMRAAPPPRRVIVNHGGWKELVPRV